MYTYTPTATARHAAAKIGATSAVTTDTVTVKVTDSKGAFTTRAVTVAILPNNAVPVAKSTVGTPNTSTGVVTGSVTATDADNDVRTYTATANPAKGNLTMNATTGAFTYTPTATARHAAAKSGATAADKTDTFTVTVTDGYGGSVAVPVTVAVSPTNTAPTNTKATVGAPNAATGVVTGSITATDAERDELSFSAPTSAAKGIVTVNASTGAFTYTPTTLARQNAAKTGATAADKTDTFTVSVTDGYGGAATVSIAVAISPYYEPNTVIAKLRVSSTYSAPRGLTISPDGKRVYVLNAGGGQVPVIETATNTLANPLTVTTQTGFTPTALALSPDGTRLYAANSAPRVVGAGLAGTISVVNVSTNTITNTLSFDTGTNPGALVISPDGQRVYVTSIDDYGRGRVWVIDTATNTAIRSLTGVNPTGLSVSPDSKRLYVGTQEGDLLFVDTQTYAVTDQVKIDGGFVVSRDGQRVYSCAADGTVTTTDTATKAIISTIKVGSKSAGMAISADGRRLYVADYYRDTVSVVDTNTNTIAATIPVDRVPSGLVLSPDGTRLYVTCNAGGTVSVIAT